MQNYGNAGDVLPLDATVGESGSCVRDFLHEKHPWPDAHPPATETLLSPEPSLQEAVHPVLFDRLDGDLIRTAAMRVHGGAGPSGVDACGWRRLCTAFGQASSDLCHALAAFGRRLCTDDIPFSVLDAFVACRLIPLDKRPGVRPIGVCEVARRIVGKAILMVIGNDNQEAAGTLQLCAGQSAGIEAAIHAARQLYDDDSTEGLLLVDASQAHSQGGFGGCGRTPLFLGPKKIIDGSCVFRCDRACTAVGLRIHGPEVAEPNLESIAVYSLGQ